MLTAACCNGGWCAGSIKQSIAGLDWVAGHMKKPAVVLLSLGILDNDLSRSLDQVPAGLFQILDKISLPLVLAVPTLQRRAEYVATACSVRLPASVSFPQNVKSQDACSLAPCIDGHPVHGMVCCLHPRCADQPEVLCRLLCQVLCLISKFAVALKAQCAAFADRHRPHLPGRHRGCCSRCVRTHPSIGPAVRKA